MNRHIHLIGLFAVLAATAVLQAVPLYTHTVTGNLGGKMYIDVEYLGAFTATFGAKETVDRYNIYFRTDGAATDRLAGIDFAITGDLFQIWKDASYDSEFDIYNGTVSADGTSANLPSPTLPTTGGSFRRFDSHFMQNADVRTDKTAPKEDIASGAIYTENGFTQYQGYGTFLGGVYGITTAAQTNSLLVAQLDLARNTTATLASGTYSMQYSSYDQVLDEFGNPVLDEYGDPIYVNTLHTSTVTAAGQVSDASGEKFSVNGLVIQNTPPVGPTGNNSKLWVGSTEPTGAGQGSSLTQNFGRVMKSTTQSALITLHNSGTDATTTNASVTLTGDALYSGTVTSPQTLSNFGTVSTVNVGMSTTTTGVKSGTVTIDNQATDSAGTSLGSNNGNAVITVTGTVLDNRTFNTPSATMYILKGGRAVNTTVTVTSTGAHNLYANGTVAATSQEQHYGALRVAGSSVLFDGTTTSGNWAITGTPDNAYASMSDYFTLKTNGEAGISFGQTPNNVIVWLYGAVGLAVTADSGTNNTNAFVTSNALRAAVWNTESYATWVRDPNTNIYVLSSALSSKTTAGGDVIGTEAIFLGGTNTTGAQQNVSMNWRDRITAEQSFASDIVQVSGMTLPGGRTQGSRSETTLYCIQLSYDETRFNEAWKMANGGISLFWLNQDTNSWGKAVAGNFGGTATYYPGHTFNPATDLVLGNYGVDTVNNVVWAVLNYNGQFAVGENVVVPEPATIGVLAIGGLMILARRRRR